MLLNVSNGFLLSPTLEMIISWDLLAVEIREWSEWERGVSRSRYTKMIYSLVMTSMVLGYALYIVQFRQKNSVWFISR